MQKTAGKNTKYSRNKTILKIGHLAKAIDLARWSVWLKNSKGQRRAKNDYTSTLELFCAKNLWKKHHIFEKWDQFENRPSCKGYRICKMVSLGQKLKWPKTYKKRFYKYVRVVLCKKLLEKRTKYSRNETILKIGHLAKAIDLARWSVWLKNSNGQKRAINVSTSTLELFCAKNLWKKHQILEKWDPFENRPSCKGYRLCKMVSLAQKFKWPKTCEKRFYKHVRVVLCKKPLQKNNIYSRNETILKIGHLAKAIDFAKCSVWVKNSKDQKRAKTDSTSTLELFCAKNRWKKHQIFDKWDHFENRPSCKGYRLCKMISFGQKLK